MFQIVRSEKVWTEDLSDGSQGPPGGKDLSARRICDRKDR